MGTQDHNSQMKLQRLRFRVLQLLRDSGITGSKKGVKAA